MTDDLRKRMITIHDAGISVAAAYQRGLEDGRDRCRRVHLAPVDESEDDWSPDPGSADTDSHDCTCGYGGFHEPLNPRCDRNHAVSGQVDEPPGDGLLRAAFQALADDLAGRGERLDVKFGQGESIAAYRHAGRGEGYREAVREMRRLLDQPPAEPREDGAR